MNEGISLNLTQELFQLMKRIPHLKLMRISMAGLTRSEIELLMVLQMNLDEAKKTLTVSDISNLLQITPAGVTHMVNSLEQTRYIKRLRDPKDRRIVLIGLTTKGIRAAETMVTNFQEQFVSLFIHLGEEDSKIFVSLMSKVLDFFESPSVN
jgi:DNA-binding MarR family transcriptional regulator